MGGYGSGRTREKTTVEECRIISVSDFTSRAAFQHGVHITGELIWTNTLTGKKRFSMDYEVDRQRSMDCRSGHRD